MKKKQLLALGALCLAQALHGQKSDVLLSDVADAPEPQAANPPAAAPATVEPDKRAYGVLPNYRTAELGAVYTPITVKQKFTIARKDSLDWPSYLTASMFAGISQLNNSNPSFGQGMAGFGKRYGSSAVDQVAGNFLSEAIMPSLLHQDPRYFRKGKGSTASRLLYAASRSVIAKSDKGNWTFNASEFLGNGMVASLGNLYYKDDRGFSPTMQRMFSQILTDSLSQCLKEYWPDVKAFMERRKARKAAAASQKP